MSSFMKEAGEAKKDELRELGPQPCTNLFSHTVPPEELCGFIASLWDII